MSNNAIVESEQLGEMKDDKKKKKKSVKSSEGKSKSSVSRKSSDVTDETKTIENYPSQKFDNGKTKENSQDSEFAKEIKDSAQKSEEKNSIILREMDFRKLAELKEAFHLFDINRDGYIDREDLRFTFTSMGKPDVTEESLDQMLSEMSSSAVDFDTFVKIFGYKAVELDPEEELLAALSNWDYLGNGMISEERLKRDLQAWGDKFSAIEADRALEEAPLYKKDGDTMIDYKKFCHDLCALRNVERTRKIEREAEAYEKDLGSLVK